MHLATAEIMRNLDYKTINETGIPGIVLMENAGRGVFNFLCSQFKDLKDKKISLIAGSGNNGGDGLVVARYLTNNGIYCKVFLLSSIEKIKGDALINLHIIQNMGIPLIEITSLDQWKMAVNEIKGTHLLIDAIFGTGLNTEIKDFFKNVVQDINELSLPKISIDIPSGVNASNGKIMGVSIKADFTITLGLPKVGHFTYPGADFIGSLKLVDISIPKSLIYKENIPYNLLTFDDVSTLLKERRTNSHKGDYGHLLVLAGSPGKTGAATLTCEAALRIGTGLVTLGIPKSLNSIMEEKLTEVMTEPLPEEEPGFLCIKAWEILQKIIHGKTVLAIGPGISTRKEVADLVNIIIENVNIPLVLDADGINCLSKNLSILKRAKTSIILTPHPGEMSRLLNLSSREVQEDRINLSRGFAQEYQVYLVLKGSKTIIADPNGTVWINPTGNPGMASGGVGDTLTGMIGGLIAQGYSIKNAILIAVFSHGLIADKIAQTKSRIGITAGDIIQVIPETIEILYKKDSFSANTQWCEKNLYV